MAFPILPLIGAGVGIMNDLIGASSARKRQRVEEEYNRRAYAGRERQDEANQLINPAANTRAGIAELSTTRDNALATAGNVAAGQSAVSGDVANPMGAGIRGASAVLGAGTPYAQQAASIRSNQIQGEQQKVAQGENIQNSIANLSNHVSYVNDKSSPVGDIIKASLSGANAIMSIRQLMEHDGEAQTPTPGQPYDTTRPPALLVGQGGNMPPHKGYREAPDVPGLTDPFDAISGSIAPPNSGIRPPMAQPSTVPASAARDLPVQPQAAVAGQAKKRTNPLFDKFNLMDLVQPANQFFRNF